MFESTVTLEFSFSIQILLTIITLITFAGLAIGLTIEKKKDDTITKNIVLGLLGIIGVFILFVFVSIIAGWLISWAVADSSLIFLGCMLAVMFLIYSFSEFWAFLQNKAPNSIYASSLVKCFWSDDTKLQRYGFLKMKQNKTDYLCDLDFYINATVHNVTITKDSKQTKESLPCYFSNERAVIFLSATKQQTMKNGAHSNLKLAETVGLSSAAVASEMGEYNVSNSILRWFMHFFAINLGKWLKWPRKTQADVLPQNSILAWIRSCFTVYFKLLAVPLFQIVFVILPFGLEFYFINSSYEHPWNSNFLTLWNWSGVLVILATIICLHFELADAITQSAYIRMLKDISLASSCYSTIYKKIADGGHIDNLGLFPLIVDPHKWSDKIISIDAGYDNENTQSGLHESLSLIKLHIERTGDEFTYTLLHNPKELKPKKLGECAERTSNEVKWCWINKENNKIHREGKIKYIRTVMVNEFSNNIHLFHNINPEMPHKKTSETHFSLNDFENYLNFGKELISDS